MTTIDWRTRFAGPAEARTAEQLFAELTDRLADTGTLAARGVEQLGLDTLGFDVDGTRAHLVVDGGRLVLREGLAADGVVARARRVGVLGALRRRGVDLRAPHGRARDVPAGER